LERVNHFFVHTVRVPTIYFDRSRRNDKLDIGFLVRKPSLLVSRKGLKMSYSKWIDGEQVFRDLTSDELQKVSGGAVSDEEDIDEESEGGEGGEGGVGGEGGEGGTQGPPDPSNPPSNNGSPPLNPAPPVPEKTTPPVTVPVGNGVSVGGSIIYSGSATNPTPTGGQITIKIKTN